MFGHLREIFHDGAFTGLYQSFARIPAVQMTSGFILEFIQGLH